MKSYIGPKQIGQKKKALEKFSKQRSTATLITELQKVFNEFIRKRDTKWDKGQPYFICISCQTPKALDQMHCGHYFSVGGHPSVRFDELNGNGQCAYCNTYQHGNLVKYKENLIKKIGQSAFNILEIRSHNRSKLMGFEVSYLIEEYKGKIQAIQ